jgi:PadR family transcriptional regulator PadR
MSSTYFHFLQSICRLIYDFATILHISLYLLLTLLCYIQYNVRMMNIKQNSEFEKLKLEIRRGAIVLVAMSQLQKEKYGYSLINSLNEKGFEIGQDTLYPMLRRLEAQGLLDSQWRVEDPRPRRYYKLNDAGREVLALLTAEWRQQEEVLRRLLNETEKNRK